MSSGGLLLLLGLLTLCAELTPVSSQQRPEYCNLPPDRRICRRILREFYFKPDINTCSQFNYGGCEGNQNHFKTMRECNRVCHGK
uniref:Kunitz-type protease inhibitor 1d n=3 Tax=Micrurus TaxID=8634 RepID=A0A194AR93_9SAUR